MSGQSQPTLNQAYETAGNPISKEPAEQAQSAQNAKADSLPSTHRGPNDQPNSDPTPTSLGRGVHGAPPTSEPSAAADRSNELDAAQMGAPGEGKISSAVDRKPGASGNEPGLESDLDRKKAEQRDARANVQSEQSAEVDVGGALGQRGGPANPVN